MNKSYLAGGALLFVSNLVLAQMTPVGTWHTIDDASGSRVLVEQATERPRDSGVCGG